jgi:hypothetical protein
MTKTKVQELCETPRQILYNTGLKINFSKTLAVKINLALNLLYNLGNECDIQWQNNGKCTLHGIK